MSRSNLFHLNAAQERIQIERLIAVGLITVMRCPPGADTSANRLARARGGTLPAHLDPRDMTTDDVDGELDAQTGRVPAPMTPARLRRENVLSRRERVHMTSVTTRKQESARD